MKQLLPPVLGKLKTLLSGKSLHYAKWFTIVLKIKGAFSVLINAKRKLAAATTLLSGKSSCIISLTRAASPHQVKCHGA